MIRPPFDPPTDEQRAALARITRRAEEDLGATTILDAPMVAGATTIAISQEGDFGRRHHTVIEPDGSIRPADEADLQ